MDVMTPDDAVIAELGRPGSTELIVPVILSGGSGTRLWPVSRDSLPKQFWPLVGDRSLVENTVRRATGDDFASPIVVCNADHRFLVAEHMRLAGVADARIVLEPVGRDSAPAIAAAAVLVAESDPKAVLWIMAADAHIPDKRAERDALRAAVGAAQAGYIVTFGMRPSRPDTAYGYIEIGKPLGGHDGVHALAHFVEKPDAATAEILCACGRHLWNSGMFVATAETLIAELNRHAPQVLAAVREAVAGRVIDQDFVRLEPTAFGASPKISIDHAVAEHTTRGAVVPADLGWSDIGSWGALWDVGEKDAAGNVAVGDVLLEGSSNCYVRSDGVLTTVVGLRDAVVVVTRDAVLAVDRAKTQDIKKIVGTLRERQRPEATTHHRVHRPWGYYESLVHGDRFQVKRIVVSPGQKLSLQKHFHRAEHWVVVGGSARVTRDDETRLVRENESIYLPLGCVHRLDNPGRIPVTLIEVQTGAYLGEDDIVRIEDTYGRD